MFTIFLSLFFVSFFVLFFFYSYYSYEGRFSCLNSHLLSSLRATVNSTVGFILLYFLFVCFILTNLLGNIPLNSIPTMFYSFTFTISLLFWFSIMICVSITQLNSFIAHILPYGAPVGLMLFLPLIEIFSQIIRPLTLIIRLSTNLSSGHIMIYIFSYFTLLSSLLSPFIYLVLYLLFFLELAISALQAYIFVSLISLYIEEVV